MLTPENLIALFTLTLLEVVLGIDNVVFIAILTEKVDAARQTAVRRVGLTLAMLMRIGLLLSISWIVSLTEPFFTVFDHGFSWRDVILLVGGIFLMGKAILEIHTHIEEEPEQGHSSYASIPMVLFQIAIFDLIFSLDSVITAVGVAKYVPVMVTAIIVSVLVMIIFAERISKFILSHPTVKILALSFLILIGFVLLADGLGKHIEKGYIYFAMGFSIVMEMLNMRLRAKRRKKELRQADQEA